MPGTLCSPKAARPNCDPLFGCPLIALSGIAPETVPETSLNKPTVRDIGNIDPALIAQ
jgi:hypothetical protein